MFGIFPEDWKLTNIVSIFKKGKRDFVENYRPISLLLVISKVLERCVLAGLRNYIQLFRQRLSHKSVKTYATMPISIMGKKRLALLD